MALTPRSLPTRVSGMIASGPASPIRPIRPPAAPNSVGRPTTPPRAKNCTPRTYAAPLASPKVGPTPVYCDPAALPSGADDGVPLAGAPNCPPAQLPIASKMGLKAQNCTAIEISILPQDLARSANEALPSTAKSANALAAPAAKPWIVSRSCVPNSTNRIDIAVAAAEIDSRFRTTPGAASETPRSSLPNFSIESIAQSNLLLARPR